MDKVTSVHSLVCALQTCRKNKNLAFAKHVLALICIHGLESHSAIENHVVPMLVDYECLSDAQHIFNKLVHSNEHLWTNLLSSYVEWGKA